MGPKSNTVRRPTCFPDGATSPASLSQDPGPCLSRTSSEGDSHETSPVPTRSARAAPGRGGRAASRTGAISPQELETFAAKVTEGEASLEAARASAETARLNLEFCRITSPIDGKVGRALRTVGNLVSQDQTMLTTLVSVAPM